MEAKVTHVTLDPYIHVTRARDGDKQERRHMRHQLPQRMRRTMIDSEQMHPRISGMQATYMALEAAERGPIHVNVADEPSQPAANGIVPSARPGRAADRRKAPPRVRKPSPGHDRCLAPSADLEGHRARMREAFGNTMSDEFVDVMLGKLVEALRPSPHDLLDEPTLNAGLALINSIEPPWRAVLVDLQTQQPACRCGNRFR